MLYQHEYAVFMSNTFKTSDESKSNKKQTFFSKMSQGLQF